MSPAGQRVIIHVDMDAFYASVEQLDDPQLQGQAVIVGGLGNRGVVAAASYEARRLGVYSAMPVARARRLAPRACYVRPRMSRYREMSALVFGVFRDHTPLVEGLSLDEAFLDVSGSLLMYDTREQIGESIRDGIFAATGLHASVGLAHNKFLAKLASDADKPRGFVSVAADKVQAFLDPMPIGRLWGIGRKTEPRLRASGILTIGQLRTADTTILRSLLGNRAGHFLALSRGEDEREVEPARPDKSISHEITFDVDVTERRELRAEMLRQAERVMRRLRKQQLAARTVTIKIRDRRFHTVTRSVTLRSAITGTRTVFQVADGLLSRWLDEHGNTPVRLIGTGVSGLEPAQESATGRNRLDETVDQITDRFGDAKLTRGLALKGKTGKD